jgi:hypothetical protein
VLRTLLIRLWRARRASLSSPGLAIFFQLQLTFICTIPYSFQRRIRSHLTLSQSHSLISHCPSPARAASAGCPAFKRIRSAAPRPPHHHANVRQTTKQPKPEPEPKPKSRFSPSNVTSNTQTSILPNRLCSTRRSIHSYSISMHLCGRTHAAAIMPEPGASTQPASSKRKTGGNENHAHFHESWGQNFTKIFPHTVLPRCR